MLVSANFTVRTDNNAGFTLVEVVVALGVLSLILLATVSALRTFANTQVSLGRLAGQVDEVRTVSGLLRDLLASAVPGKKRAGGLSLGGGTSELAYFEGNSSSLAWKSSALFGESFGGTLLLRLVKEDDLLMLYWQEPNTSSRVVQWANSTSRVIVNGVEEFLVEFKPEIDLEWQIGEWEALGAPALVRLSIKADGRYWPDLIMQVQR
ncbi:MAG: general secretion pathway protein J [Halioglobus sp.]|jgi:general secretion pathway protein J